MLCFGFRHEFAVGRVDQLNALVAHVLQLFHKGAHITVPALRHQVVDGKGAALFQHAERFKQKLLLVGAGNVVIDIVAGHSVEALVREIQFRGIAAISEYSIPLGIQFL